MTVSNIQPGYKKTEIGVLPSDWLIKSIIDCTTYVDYRGKTPQKTTSGTFLVTAKNIRNGFIDYETSQEYVSQHDYDNIMRRGKPQIGDILITTEAPLGNTAAVDNENVALAQRIIKYRAKEEILLNVYLKYYFQSKTFQKILDENSSGSTAKGIKGSILHKLPLILPPTLQEQRAIATALSDVDALIRSLGELIDKKRAVKQGAMQELLTGKRRLAGFEDNWNSKSLDGLTERIYGGGTPSRAIDIYWHGQIPWITVKDFSSFDSHGSKEYITELGLKNSSSSIVPKGNVITSTRMALGKAVIYEVDVAINQDLKAIITSRELLPLYLFYWFQLFGSSLESKGGGSTVLGLSSKDLKNIILNIPGVEEQRGIAQILSDMDAEITALETKQAKYQQIKQGMMQELLTGKTRLV